MAGGDASYILKAVRDTYALLHADMKWSDIQEQVATDREKMSWSGTRAVLQVLGLPPSESLLKALGMYYLATQDETTLIVPHDGVTSALISRTAGSQDEEW